MDLLYIQCIFHIILISVTQIACDPLNDIVQLLFAIGLDRHRIENKFVNFIVVAPDSD